MAILTAAASDHETIAGRRASGADNLLAWRLRSGFGWVEGVALALFVGIAGYALHFHEAWDDEAQAWLIARDNSVWEIMRTRLHYEGAPPAWHLLLHAFHLLGGSYVGLGWLSIALATAGMYVWLRWSPFPAVLRFLLPFTFFFQYQYAVIARSYVLVPLLVFSLCALFTRRRHFLWFAILAGVLANVSLHGFVLAIVLCGLYVWEGYGDRALTLPAVRRQQRVAAGLFCALAFVAFYCAIPAPDLDFAIGQQVSGGTINRMLMVLIGETPRNAPRPAPEAPITAPLVERPFPTLQEPKAWLAEAIYPRRQPADYRALRSTLQIVGPSFVEFIDQASWPLANSALLAFAFLITAALWLRARRRLRMLLPWLALIITGHLLWTAEHHAGLLLVALLAGLWLTVTTTSSAEARIAPRLQNTVVILLGIMLTVQIGWSAYCIRQDVLGMYDPGPDTAKWLKEQGKPRMAAFGFGTVSIQPWFASSPFFNLPTSWWQWSSNVEVDGIHRQIIATHPDIVVYGIEFPGIGLMRDQVLPLTHISQEEEDRLPHDYIVRDLHENGYVETHRFCGRRFARFSYAYRECDLIFEPAR